MSETCYMCEALAIGREHVPPRCLFPEVKDLPGTNYRENPITVPSCDAHNSAKSKDDEYMMFVLTAFVLNNPVAKQHIDTKVMRAFKRNPKIIASLTENGHELGGGLACLSVDSRRIFNVCEHIVRGLHFHRFNRKWLLPIRFLSPAFLPANEKVFGIYNKHKEFERCAEMLLEQGQSSFRGESPDIFKYRLLGLDEGSLVVQLVFYGGVYVSGISRTEEGEL